MHEMNLPARRTIPFLYVWHTLGHFTPIGKFFPHDVKYYSIYHRYEENLIYVCFQWYLNCIRIFMTASVASGRLRTMSDACQGETIIVK